MKKKIVGLVIVCVFYGLLIMSTYANELFDFYEIREIEDEKKIWTIRFNHEISVEDEACIEDKIIVQENPGFASLDVVINLKEDRRTVEVIPKDNYIIGVNYTLYIDKIKDIYGNELEGRAALPFYLNDSNDMKFKDENFEHVIRKNLNLGEKSITISDLDKIDSLEITETDDIKTFSDLKTLKNLRYLTLTGLDLKSLNEEIILGDIEKLFLIDCDLTSDDLYFNSDEMLVVRVENSLINNMKCFSNIKKVHAMEFKEDNIKSFDYIDKIDVSVEISIDNIIIEDVKSLNLLKSLVNINFDSSNYNDLDFLLCIENISRAELSYDDISKMNIDVLNHSKGSKILKFKNFNVDMEELSKVEEIISLELENCTIDNYDGIMTTMESLEYFSIADSNIENLNYLNYMPELIGLSIKSSKIEDINVVGNLQHLTTLDIANNKIKDISSIENLNYLEILYIQGNPIETIANLKNMDNLVYITLDEEVYERFKEVMIYLEENRVDISTM